MPGSSIQGMIQTIVALRRLQLEEDAQNLQAQQLGISRDQLKLQQNAAPLNSLGNLQQVLGGMQNPNAFQPYASQFAQQAGMPTDALQTLINQTPARTETTRAGAVQRGMNPTLDQPAATQALTGGTESDLLKSDLLSKVFGQTGDYYSSLKPEEQQGFQRGVLQRLTTGESVGEAALGQATADFMGRAPQATRDQIISVGKGLAPSASEDAQTRLGWARYRLDERQTETQLALEDLKTRAALQNAQHSTNAQAFKEVNDLLDHRSQLMQNAVRNSATMTPEAVRSFGEQLNAFNEQIRAAVPSVYGPKGTHPLTDLPTDKTLGATSLMDYFRARLGQP